MDYRSITAAQVRENLTYDPDTGLMYWAISKSGRRLGKPVGTLSNNGYLKFGLFGHNVYVHRVVWLHVHGEWPEHDIDHINGDRSDNRIANLRAATREENLQNMRNRSAGISGVRGVTFDKQTGKWRAQLRAFGKRINIGRFSSLEAAERAYIEARDRYHPYHTGA